MAALALIETAEANLAITRAKAVEMAQVVEVCPLETEEHEAQAVRLLGIVKGMTKTLDAERKALIGPADKEVRSVNKAYKAVKDDFLRVEKLLKGRLGEAQTRREEARAAALAQVAEATADGDTEAAQAALDQARGNQDADHKGISYADDWEIMLVNVHAVPREYMTPDMAQVRAYLKANPDGQIDGFQIKRIKKVSRARASV